MTRKSEQNSPLKTRVSAYIIYVLILNAATLPITLFVDSSFSEHLARSFLFVCVLLVMPLNHHNFARKPRPTRGRGGSAG